MNNQINIDITFLLFTWNEETRIEEMLRCLSGHGNIIVIDNFSTDSTLNIAKKYTENIYQHKNIGYVENEKTIEFALNLARTKWVYLAYADELIPNILMCEITKIVKEDTYEIVEIYRRNFMYGQEVFNYGKHHLRLFVKDSVDFKSNIVHKLGKYKADKKKIYKINKNKCIFHFSAYNSDRLEMVHNRYANLESEQRKDILKQNFSGLRALFKLFFFFFGTYFGLGGFRGGWPGLFISIQIAYFKFSIEARLWEIDNNVNISSMNMTYAQMKELILSEYDK
jgi:glycosyltransferase involved in cell wall biosynthesis